MVFFSTVLGQYVVQVLAHSVLMALVVEALLKLWQVSKPGTRVRFRLLYLLVPLAGWPIYQLIWPERGSLDFRQDMALIDSQRWLSMDLVGIPGWVWVALMMGLGVLLFVSRALVPTGQHHLLGKPSKETSLDPGLSSKLENSLRNLNTLPDPHPIVVDEPWATTYLSGVNRPRLVVSARLVEILDEKELEAALSHESAHALHWDNPRGWTLLLLGCLMFYNPVALIALQRISQDVEMACDDASVAQTGHPLALASALVKATRFNAVTPVGALRPAPVGWLSRLDTLVGRNLVVQRVQRLLTAQSPAEVPLQWLKLGLTASFSLAMLFFVV